MRNGERGKTLITGATGFIGSALAHRLLRRGDDLRVITRSPDRFSNAGFHDQVEITVGDITAPDAVRAAVAGCDRIYSIAAAFREPGLSDTRYHEVNVEAVGHLIAAASEYGVERVVHCSTCGIYGNVPTKKILDETAAVVPEGIYEVSKARGDELARKLGFELGVEVCVIRPTPVYGPGDTRLLKLFKMCNQDRVLMLGPGTAGYHLVYIDDLVDALIVAGEAAAGAGEAFLIGGNEIPSLNDLIAELARVLGREEQKLIRLPAAPVRLLAHANEIVCRPFGIDPLLFRRRVDFFTNNRAFDIGKARELLGFRAKIKMAVGLRRTANWYRDQGMLPRLGQTGARDRVIDVTSVTN